MKPCAHARGRGPESGALATAVAATLALLGCSVWVDVAVSAASVSGGGDFSCSVYSQCNEDQACVKGKCVNPCLNACGKNARCTLVSREPNCSCIPGFIGDALVECFPKHGYIDEPSCQVWSQCGSHRMCIQGRCEDPCITLCTRSYTVCEVINHEPDCRCQEGTIGKPEFGCFRLDGSETTKPPPSKREVSSSPPPPPPQDTLSALHRTCLRCLCAASTSCDRDYGCQEGYCGPFGVSRMYWHEAGRPVLEHDDPERKQAYEDCAKEYNCASRIVTEYLKKLAKDCNGDGRINCDDFAMTHHNGGHSCHLPLNRTEAGANYLKRYLTCRDEEEEPYPSRGVVRSPSTWALSLLWVVSKISKTFQQDMVSLW